MPGITKKADAVQGLSVLEIIDANTPTELRYLLFSQLKVRFQLQDVVLCLIDQHKDTARLFFDQDEKTRTDHRKQAADT
ncbi:MAG: hypothetical protein R2813_00090 [Flavobacteriales bacterium]